ncbi:MAG: hypothetical protein JXN10_05725, partial [Clostridia bacterium]|nr:hypothetical protein [Clostridia bacterium]
MKFTEQLKNKYNLIIHFMGITLIFNGIVMLVPLLVLPFYGNEKIYAINFIIPALSAILSGMVVWGLTRKKNHNGITVRDGGVMVVFAWILTCLVSSIPFLMLR